MTKGAYEPPHSRSFSAQYPALAAWLARHARGGDSAEARDALWRAACWEQSAAAFARDGLHAVAEQCRERARAVLAEVTGARPV